jgi:hypothetical protein
VLAAKLHWDCLTKYEIYGEQKNSVNLDIAVAAALSVRNFE